MFASFNGYPTYFSIVVFFILTFSLKAQTQIYLQDFETNAGYSTSIPEFTDNNEDYFIRTDGTNINPSYLGKLGNFFFAAQDIDGEGASAQQSLMLSNINIAYYTNLEFRVHLAEEDASNGDEDWDSSDYVHISYEVDNSGSYTPLLHIESRGGSTNTEPAIDTNFDGVGDGIALSPSFQQFVEGIPATGQSLNLKIEFNLDSEDEDIAIDHIEIYGTPTINGDATTEIFAPLNQVTAGIIDAVNATSSGNAEEVFGFIIEDQGSGDNLPTYVNQMRFVPAAGNTALWEDHLAGITLIDENLNSYTINPINISNQEIILGFNPPISIGDGASLEFLMGVYLKEQNIVDGADLQFKISAANHGFTAANNGSTFSDPFLLGDITSNVFTIAVDASELRFFQQPSDVFVNQTMSPPVQVIATDTNGNIDTDYNLSVNLTSTGSLAGSPVTETAVNGMVSFANISHTQSGTGLQLSVDDGLFPVQNSLSFSVFNAAVAPTPGTVYITEISDATNYENEFIEIFNASDQIVEMKDIKLVMDNNKVWRVGDLAAGSNADTYIHPNAFMLISRGATQAAFEQEFGAINTNTRFIAGSQNMFFGTGTARRWRMFIGGTVNTADGSLLDDTQTDVAVEDRRNYQNILTNEFIDTDSAQANPGELDYLLFMNDEWVNQLTPDVTNIKDILIGDNWMSENDFSGKNLFIAPNKKLINHHYLQLSGNKMQIDGELIFGSKSPAQMGTLGPIPNTMNIQGEVEVERIIPPKRAYRLLSSSVTSTRTIHEQWQEGANNLDYSNFLNPNPGYGTHITGSTTGQNGFDATPSGNPSLWSFDNANQQWFAVSSTLNTSLQAGTPHRLMVRGSRDINVTQNASQPDTTRLRMRGNLTQTGNFEVPSSVLNTTPGAFNFVGNPYQAQVDLNQVLSRSVDINPNQYYIWDPNKNVRGGFVVVDLPSGTNSDGSEANAIIQVNQAFFVRTGGANPKIIFNQADKVNQNFTQVFRSNKPQDLALIGQLYANEASNMQLTDSFIIRFDAAYTNQVNDADAAKMGNLDENIAIINQNDYLSIERREMPVKGDTLDLFVNNYRFSDYRLNFDLPAFGGVSVFLLDRYLHQETPLTKGANQVDFTIDEDIPQSIAANRFALLFKQKNLANPILKKSSWLVYPNPFTDYFQVKAESLIGQNLSISIYNQLGVRIKDLKLDSFSGEESIYALKGLPNGFYYIQLQADDIIFTQKLIKK